MEAVALADGVENGAVVSADFYIGFLVDNVARFGSNILGEEFTDADFADEANAHGFGFLGDMQAVFFGEGLDFGFGEIAEREESFLEGSGGNAGEEISLVFLVVFGSVETAVLSLGVVAGGDEVGAVGEAGIEKEVEFDFLVAPNVGVWGVAFLVFVNHVSNDAIEVGFLEVENVEVEAEVGGDAFTVGEVFGPGALGAGQGFGPVFHVDADDVVALFF